MSTAVTSQGDLTVDIGSIYSTPISQLITPASSTQDDHEVVPGRGGS